LKPAQGNCKTLSQNYSTEKNRAGGMAQVVECLASVMPRVQAPGPLKKKRIEIIKVYSQITMELN
jgi:hypothetical protein